MNPNDHRELRCEYCDRTLVKVDPIGNDPLYATRDHFVPKSKNRGGPHKMVWACRLCNSLKADRMPEQWTRFMQRNPRWWEHPYFTGERRRRVTLPPERKPPPPYWQTMRFLRNAEFRDWRPLRKDEPIPKRYDNPVAQAAYEAVYKDRKWMLRVGPGYNSTVTNGN